MSSHRAAKRLRILLVPSCGIVPFNQLATSDTLYRCERGLELWWTGEYDALLLTGGIFNPSEVQTVPASILMREWFCARGVAKERIFCEADSLDTFENIRFGVKLLDDKGLWPCKVTVATQWQHAIRFLIAFALVFGVVIHPHFLRQPISWRTWCWEWVFILYHLWDWKGMKGVAVRHREKRRQKPS